MRNLLIVCISMFSISGISFADIDASIISEPENPTPYSTVRLTLRSYSFDVNSANISWSANGRVISSGIGEKTITVNTGKVGERATVNVSVTASDGASFNTSLNIIPASVDLMYESPESNVPLFYDGRSLPGEGAQTRVTAVANIFEGGAIVSADRLSYSWYYNGSLVPSVSGRGRQVASFRLDYLDSKNDIKVRVSSPRGLVTEKSISIYPHAIIPALYTYDEILGVNYSTLISRRFEAVKDFTLALEPYYISTGGTLSDGISYNWLLDGLPVTPLGGTLLTLTPKEESYGERRLSISVSNLKRRLQDAKTDLDIIFDTRR